MVEVGGVIVAMTNGAREHRIVRRVCVARRAHAVRVPVIDVEERVVRGGQHSREPRRRGVACCAGGWPASGYVVRIRSPRVVRLVAGVAVGWRSHKDVVDVT